MTPYENPEWPDGSNGEKFCSCDDAWEWPRGIGFDGDNYRCPSCKGLVPETCVKGQKIIPRSKFLGLDPLKEDTLMHSQTKTSRGVQDAGGNSRAIIAFVIGLVLVLWLISENSSNDVYYPTDDNTSPITQTNPSPRTNYYSEPCEDTYTREEYQDCLEDLWADDYRNDMKYNYDAP